MDAYFNWIKFKTFVDRKKLSIQWLDDDSQYHLIASEGALIARCLLIKNEGVDVVDFETNYKALGNKPILTNSKNPVVTSINGINTPFELVAENLDRKGLIITTNNVIAYLRFGIVAATTTIYTVKIPNNGYYEAPYHYIGAIQCICSSNGGNIIITELT